MFNQNVMPLSLNGDTFNAMKSDFDIILRKTISNMELKGADTAELNIKLKVSLEKDQTRDFDAAYDGAMRDIIKPKFDHTVQSVLQIKDKKDGTLSGNYELVWDPDEQKYVMREITNGQTTLFDKTADGSTIIDVGYTHIEDEQPALQGRKIVQLPPPREEETVEGGAEDDLSPFDWLLQFAGAAMKVMDALNIYTVRTEDNRVVLSSGAFKNSPFYVPAEKLAPHVGHSVVCVASPSDEERPEQIDIWCEECDELLFSMKDGIENEPDNEDARDEDLDEGPEEDGSYDYEPPEDDAQ